MSDNKAERVEKNSKEFCMFVMDVTEELAQEHRNRQNRADTLQKLQTKYEDTPFHHEYLRSHDIFGHFIRKSGILNRLTEARKNAVETDEVLVEENGRLCKELEKEKKKTHQLINATLSKIAAMPLLSPKPIIRTKSGTKSPSELVVGFSDAQIGSRITTDETFGISEYNFDIFSKRFSNYIKGIISIYEKESLDHTIERINIAMLGDNIENETIYKGQGFYLDRNTIDQVYDGAQVCAKGFAELTAAVGCPVEFLCVDGNHGRPGMKGENHQRTNWDHVFCRTVQAYLKDYENKDRVKWNLARSPTMILDIQGHIFALCHGDSIKGSLSIPFYGGEREKRGLQGMTDLPIEFVFVGDKHRSGEFDVDAGQVIFNGCFPGGSQLSVNQMRQAGTPKQTMMNITKRYGMSGKYYLYLADSKPVKLEKNGRIYTPVVTE